MSPKIEPIEMEAPPGTSSIGCGISSTSISITKLLSFPARSSLKSLPSNTSFAVSPRSSFLDSRIIFRTRFSAAEVAFAFTSSSFSAFTSRYEHSARSRIMPSTSLPTYPTSVYFVASTFTNGARTSFASRRAISVFPTPVGPFMIMFFGVISSRTSLGKRLLL